MKGLEEAGAQVEEIHLNEKKLEHCRACANGWGTCNKTGTCVIRDDFSGIYQSLANADGIVWITAVYWSDMTECFKAFFDRLRRCDATRNHSLAEKRCMLIACAGGTGRGTLRRRRLRFGSAFRRGAVACRKYERYRKKQYER